MISHLIFWPAVRCDARRVVDLQWRQRRVNMIVVGALQFVYAALSRRFNFGSALCGKTTRDYTFITACGTSAATRRLPLVEAVKLLLAYQGS
jgi:hypothetical protein